MDSSYMTIDSNEEIKLIRETAKNFADKYIRPNLMEWDEAQFFPRDVFTKMGELGFMGVVIPDEYGGTGLNYQAYITIIEEISKVCGSVGLSLAAHNSLGTNHIYMFGSEEQKRKYLPKLASAEHLAFWGLTEANTGSDAMRMKCFAQKDGDYYVINGTKNWITHGISGDVGVVLVRTGDLLDSHGISAFIIERGFEGFAAGKKENKLGMRASETAELIFDNCRIHKSQLLGKEGEGFIQAMKILDGGRISIASLSLGIAKGAYDASVKYSKQREQFGQPIANFQAIAFKLADMATEIEAAELLTRKAGALKDAHLPVTKISAMAKYYASEVCVKAATESIQIHGGYGYTKDFPVEKFFRDSKLCTIGEGTSEIQKLVISRSIMKEA